jgi:hypothetical protein
MKDGMNVETLVCYALPFIIQNRIIKMSQGSEAKSAVLEIRTYLPPLWLVL